MPAALSRFVPKNMVRRFGRTRWAGVRARQPRDYKALEPEPHFEPLGTGAGWCIQVTVAKGSLWNLKLPDSLLLYLWE